MASLETRNELRTSEIHKLRYLVTQIRRRAANLGTLIQNSHLAFLADNSLLFTKISGQENAIRCTCREVSIKRPSLF